jgi:hypothetical protein
VTIAGPSADDLTISGNNASRVFEVARGATVTLSGLTIRDGFDATGGGGAIRNAGDLTLDACFVFNSVARGGAGAGGGGGGAGAGGGVYNNGDLTVVDCTFSKDEAAGGAGGALSGGGAAGFGGAIFNQSGRATITDSTFSGNQAVGGNGGPGRPTGVDNGIGPGGNGLGYTSGGGGNSDFLGAGGNGGFGGGGGGGGARGGVGGFGGGAGGVGGGFGSGVGAPGFGGGVANNLDTQGGGGSAYGGALFNFSGAVTITSCTFAHNVADGGAGGGNTGGHGFGSGIANPADFGGTVTLADTIVARSDSSTGPAPDVYGVFTSSGYNLIGDGSTASGFGAAGDQVGSSTARIDPLFASDATNNGGPTPTVALAANSPAINAGDPNFTGTGAIDQRGFARVAGGRLDIGAFESSSAIVSALALTPSPAAPVAGQALTLSVAVSPTLASSNPPRPRGSISFSIDGGAAAVVNLSNNGRWALSLPAGLAAGSHTVVASFTSGDTFYTNASSTFTVAVGQDATTTALTASGAAVSGQPLTLTAAPVNGFELTPLTNVSVATFTHGDGLEPASQFTATIDWGDGTTSPGTVTLSGGVYAVSGSHTYADERLYPVTAFVADGTASATIPTTANVREELLPDGTRGTPDQRFISEVYRDLLHRAVDPGALAQGAAQLSAGVSRAQLVRGIMNSPTHEFQAVEVQDAYRRFLHRDADEGALAQAVNFLEAGGTVEQLNAFLVGSPEYFASRGGGTTEGFLTAVFNDLFGRGPRPDERASVSAALAGGMTPQQAATSLLNTDEYRGDLVKGLYTRLLDRAADAAGFNAAVEQLRMGVRDELVVLGLLTGSDEFCNKTAS